MSDDNAVAGAQNLSRRPRVYLEARRKADAKRARKAELAARVLMASMTDEERRARKAAMREEQRSKLAEKADASLRDLVATGSYYSIFNRSLSFLRSRRAARALNKRALDGDTEAWKIHLQILKLCVAHDETLLKAMTEGAMAGPAGRQVSVRDWPSDGQKT